MSQLLINDYEQVAPWPLTRTDTPDAKALLRSDPAAGSITLDSETTLRGVPPEAWTYKLGNRCAIDWVLDQYKEKKPKTPPSARSSTAIALPTTKKK